MNSNDSQQPSKHTQSLAKLEEILDNIQLEELASSNHIDEEKSTEQQVHVDTLEAHHPDAPMIDSQPLVDGETSSEPLHRGEAAQTGLRTAPPRRRRRSSSGKSHRKAPKKKTNVLNVAIYGILGIIGLLSLFLVLAFMHQSRTRLETKRERAQLVAEQQLKTKEELRKNYAIQPAASSTSMTQQPAPAPSARPSSTLDYEPAHEALYNPDIFGLPSPTEGADESEKPSTLP